MPTASDPGLPERSWLQQDKHSSLQALGVEEADHVEACSNPDLCVQMRLPL